MSASEEVTDRRAGRARLGGVRRGPRRARAGAPAELRRGRAAPLALRGEGAPPARLGGAAWTSATGWRPRSSGCASRSSGRRERARLAGARVERRAARRHVRAPRSGARGRARSAACPRSRAAPGSSQSSRSRPASAVGVAQGHAALGAHQLRQAAQSRRPAPARPAAIASIARVGRELVVARGHQHRPRAGEQLGHRARGSPGRRTPPVRHRLAASARRSGLCRPLARHPQRHAGLRRGADGHVHALLLGEPGRHQRVAPRVRRARPCRERARRGGSGGSTSRRSAGRP